MQKRDAVSVTVIRRLPRYYRFLDELVKKDILRISSKELGRLMGLSSSQIRQDFNCFGGFGQQGYGYHVKELYEQLGQILGLEKKHKLVVVGAGNMGRALTTQMNFTALGFTLCGIFDIDPVIIGQRIRSLTVLDIACLEDFCKQYHPAVAVLTLPGAAAEEMVQKLLRYGIKGFWNFSHHDLSKLAKKIPVENVHLGDSLMKLCFDLKDEQLF